MIEKEAHKVYDYLQREYEINNLNKTEFENILLLCKDVVSELSKDTDIQERLENIMGTEILLTAEERGIEKGIEKGIFNATLENIRNLMNSYKILFDEACDVLNIQDREKYRDYII